jgi:hypothetical protein
MHTKKILQTITGNVINSAIGFLCLLVMHSYFEINTIEQYIKIINYTLILLPLIEFGISTHTASSPTLTKNTTRLQTALFAITIITLFSSSSQIALAKEILLVSIGLYCTKLASVRYQRTQKWLVFNGVNSTQNATRLAVLACLLVTNQESQAIKLITYSSLATGIICLIISGRQRLSYSEDQSIDWGFLKHYAIGCIIALAMRLDLIIIDSLLATKDFVAYGLILQLSLIFPIATNALMAVYLVNEAKRPTPIHPIKVIAVLTIASPIIYFLASLALKQLFGINGVEYTLCILALIACGLGGIYYTPHEANIYKTNPTKVIILKATQATIIGLAYPTIKIGLSESTLTVAGFVLLSRIYAWSYLYANQTTYKNTDRRL